MDGTSKFSADARSWNENKSGKRGFHTERNQNCWESSEWVYVGLSPRPPFSMPGSQAEVAATILKNTSSSTSSSTSSAKHHGQGSNGEAVCGQPSVGKHPGGAVGHLRAVRSRGQLQRAAAVRLRAPAGRGRRRARHPRSQRARVPRAQLGGGGVAGAAAALHQSVCGEPERHVHHRRSPAALSDFWESAGMRQSQRHSSSVGYAFVHMENKEDALQAIEALHGTSFKGRPLSVELSKVQPSKQTPTGKIPCVNCGKQGHYAGECPVGKPTLEQYQSQAAVLAAAAAAAAGLPLQVQQSVHNSVYNTSTFDPTYAALTGITTGTRTDGNPVNPAVYGALASQVYGANVANQLYGSVANQAALSSGAAQVYSSVAPNLYGQVAANPAAAAAYTTPVYTPSMANSIYLTAGPGIEMQSAAAVNPAYTVAPAISPAYAHITAMGAADPATAIFEVARQAHYFAQGQQVVAEQQTAAAAKSGERDRSPLRRTASLLPDPVMKPFIYQRAKPRRSLLPTPAGRAAEEASSEAPEDHVARYYADYYQQLQQYPHFQYAYPSPGAMSAIPGMQAVPAQPVAALDALRPVVPAAAAVAAAMAAPRVYEPPLPPTTRKESILRRPELSLHTPEPPFR
ncbi:RNA-binding protein 14b isoform X1 [Phycodurus eques]|uniref:RNA-binding protein 14b isoform X1 n=1 Tax=Phycodurus eques TaxID=693459 RepID=UPI002ACDD962|nr:RNA-binding protein 14b isoform X1 [Phycodurus eques]